MLMVFPTVLSSANQERGAMGSIAPRVQILVWVSYGWAIRESGWTTRRQELLYCHHQSGCAVFRTFPAEKITRIQGDFRYWQCKHTCTDEIYPNKEKVYELLDKIEGDRLPDDLIPRCSHCGTEMVPWWRSREFLEGSYYQKRCNVIWIFSRRTWTRKCFSRTWCGYDDSNVYQGAIYEHGISLAQCHLCSHQSKDAYVPKEIAKRVLPLRKISLWH